MKRKTIVMLSVVCVALLTVVFAGYHHIRYEALRHITVEVQGGGSRPLPGGGSRPSANLDQVRAVARKQPTIPLDVPPPVESARDVYAPATATAPRSITAAQLLSQLERQLPLTNDERSSLSRVFRIAANVQPGIDAEPSEERRLAYQQQLINSLQLRFKLILKDESRIMAARATLQGLPRISPDT